MRAQPNPKPALKSDQTIDSLPLNEESGTFSGVLGKRVHHETSTENLREEIEGSLDGDDEGLDSSERRERRYL